jgi:potassium efflux system protein
VLPTLGFLEVVELWRITIVDEGGGSTSQAIPLASLLLAADVIAVTVIASRNIPGVIDIGFLQRAGVDSRIRYAIRNLLQYAMYAVGLSIVLLTLGMRWSQIHWLVAVLGVGLGFGSQEIFANFISGPILLF